jgi:hypothetical protein
MLLLLERINIVYILYTTKSHKKEKRGMVNDRYRILVPFKFHDKISEDLFPLFYDKIMEVFGITSNDKATRSLSRLWFTNSEAKIYKNEDGELFDALAFLPETEKNEKLEEAIDSLKEPQDDDEISRRLFGMKKWFLANTSSGNRNDNLFKFGMFCKDLNLNIVSNIEEINSLLLDPLSGSEVNNIIKSVERR